jgi:hypothetical protein
MEKRKQKRFKTRQFAKICGKLGVVNDMSGKGVQVSTSLMPRKRKIDIVFEAFGGIVRLIGFVQWIRRKNSVNNLNRLGIVLQDPPEEYRKVIGKLM